MEKKFTLLYVDDEESNLDVFKNTFRREYNVFTAISGYDALEILNREHIDLILTDQRMPEMDGVDFLKLTLEKYPNLNRILITGYTDFNALRNAVNEAKIFQYIQKPWTEKNLKTVIESALEIYRLRQENESLTSELQKRTEQLEKANKELIDFELLKTDFLRIISHEIRTPLNGVRGYTDLIKDEINQEQINKLSYYVSILDKSVNRLESFSLSALKITDFMAGNRSLKKTDFAVLPMVEKSISSLSTKISEKQVSIFININESISINADSSLFETCIYEIVDNAIDHSPEKGIITIIAYSTTNNQIVIETNDNGSGFEQKILNNPFKLFVKSDNFIGKNIGFDLAFLKLIMEAHNGQIEILNNPNNGACVKLYFNLS